MIELAVFFLVLGLIAAVLGFTNIAGVSFAIAKVIALILLALFVVFLLLALGAVAIVA